MLVASFSSCGCSVMCLRVWVLFFGFGYRRIFLWVGRAPWFYFDGTVLGGVLMKVLMSAVCNLFCWCLASVVHSLVNGWLLRFHCELDSMIHRRA